MGNEPAALPDAALALIDSQNTCRSRTMQLEGVEAALQEARKLRERSRALGIPVIHLQRDGAPGSLYDVRAQIGAIADAVAPRALPAAGDALIPAAAIQQSGLAALRDLFAVVVERADDLR